MKKALLAILIFLLIPKIVLADVAVSVSYTNLTLIPLIILIEAFLFWLLINKIFGFSAGFWKSLLVVLVANIVTSITGTFIEVVSYSFYNNITLAFLLLTFAMSVVIEWGIYLPFFRKNHIRKTNLLKLSIMVNAVSYAIIFFFTLM